MTIKAGETGKIYIELGFARTPTQTYYFKVVPTSGQTVEFNAKAPQYLDNKLWVAEQNIRSENHKNQMDFYLHILGVVHVC